MRTRRRLGAIAAAVFAPIAVLAPGAAPAGAQEPAPVGGDRTLIVREIDATAYPEVSMTVLGTGAPLATGELFVEQDGVPANAVVASRLVDAEVPTGVVFVVDGSTAMRIDGAIDRVKAELSAMADTKPANQLWGLVQYTATARTVLRPTADADAFRQAVTALGTSSRPQAAMREGMALAMDLLKADPALQANLVVVNASRDDVSVVPASSLRGSALTSGVAVVGVNLKGDLLASGELAEIAGSTGGGAPTVPVPEVGTALRAARSAVDGQVQVTFRGTPDVTAVRVRVTAGGASTEAAVPVGSSARGVFARPVEATPVVPTGPAVLQGETGKYVGLGLAVLAVVLFLGTLVVVFTRDRGALDRVLQPYSEQPVGADDLAGNGAMAESRIVQRAVELTGQIAERRGLVTRLESRLEQADLPLRAAEAIFFAAAAVVLLTVFTFLATGSLVRTLLVLVLSALVPLALLNFRVSSRRKKFVAQLPDTLNLLAGSLKAGYSLMQGVEAVSREVEEPMGRELRRIVAEARLGRPVEDALEEAAERVESPDFAWCVMAIRIQREVGGNLAELLLTVADTMQQRDRLRRDVKSLTAEGRMSAIVLGILPIALGLVMNAVNGEYMRVLFTDTTGQMLLGVAVLMILVGFYWMKKTVEVDV